MRKFWEVTEKYGLPKDQPLFLEVQEQRAEQILDALKGLRICTALALLDQCKQALLQSTVEVD